METTNMNIRMDKTVKEQAEVIFSQLGLTMTTAVNLFLRSAIRENGIPFSLKLTPNRTTETAIIEGRKIAEDPSVKGYRDMKALRKALDV